MKLFAYIFYKLNFSNKAKYAKIYTDKMYFYAVHYSDLKGYIFKHQLLKSRWPICAIFKFGSAKLNIEKKTPLPCIAGWAGY